MRKNTNYFLPSATASLLVFASFCFGQGRLDEANANADVVEFVDKYERMFAGRDPKLDEMMPDAQAFDENGNPFELKQTRGKYTVIVFGCLT